MNDTSTIRPASTISLRDLGDAADVLDAVGVGEAEVLVEAVADVVAVEQVGVPAQRVQALLDEVGDGRLAGAGQAGEPQHAGLLALERARACLLTSSACQWMFCAAQREVQHAGADRVVVSRSIRMKPPVSRLSA